MDLGNKVVKNRKNSIKQNTKILKTQSYEL